MLQPILTTGADAPIRRAKTAKAQIIDVKAEEITTSGRPFFTVPSERYEWLIANRSEWTDADSAWINKYVEGDDYSELRSFYASRGMDWESINGDEATDAFKGARAKGGA